MCWMSRKLFAPKVTILPFALYIQLPHVNRNHPYPCPRRRPLGPSHAAQPEAFVLVLQLLGLPAVRIVPSITN